MEVYTMEAVWLMAITWLDKHKCTYNTKTLRTEKSLESLLDELQDFKWDILGLCETKREGEGIEELKGGAWLPGLDSITWEKQKNTMKQRNWFNLFKQN